MGNLLPSNPGVISFLQSGASAQPVEKDTEAGAGAGKACPKTFTLEAQGFTAAESVFMLEIKLMYCYVQTFFCLSAILGNISRHWNSPPPPPRAATAESCAIIKSRKTVYADDTKCEEE